MRDEMLRAACFARLSILCAQFGDDIPYRGGLDAGFPFGGRRIPFLARARGIHRAAAQVGPAALSVNTSSSSPYKDEQLETGFLYAYQAGPTNNADNRALHAAHELRVPIVYFVATRPWWYRALYPCYVTEDDPRGRYVIITPGIMAGPPDDQQARDIDDPLERKYKVRETRVRLHQARFRGRVLAAYSSLCAICRLKETRLLDAAHIAGDLEADGEPVVANGLALCSIHHRAFDNNLVGVSADYEVRVSQRLLEDEDGPMLELLKQSHQQLIVVPSRAAWKPDRDRLAERFDRFLAAAG